MNFHIISFIYTNKLNIKNEIIEFKNIKINNKTIIMFIKY